jgi:hypothetical protein
MHLHNSGSTLRNPLEQHSNLKSTSKYYASLGLRIFYKYIPASVYIVLYRAALLHCYIIALHDSQIKKIDY